MPNVARGKLRAAWARIVALELGAWLVVATSLGAFAFSALLPVYTDEPIWKLMGGARIFHDGMKEIWSLPQCTSGFAVSVPWFAWPTRLVDAALYDDVGPVRLRALGMAAYAVWLVGATLLLRKLDARRSFVGAAARLLSVLGLGVFPLLAVMNRPEHSLLVGVTLLVIVPLLVARSEPGRASGWLGVVALLLVDFDLLSQHAKAAFLLPVALVAGFVMLAGAIRRVVYSAVLLAATATALSYWTKRSGCPELDWQRGEVMQPGMLVHEPRAFFDNGFTNLANVMEFVDSGTFAAEYMSEWLPPHAIDATHRVVNAGMRATFVVLLVVAVGALVGAIVGLFDAKTRAPSLVVAALVVSLAGMIFFQTNRNAYNAILVLPLIALVAFVAWAHDLARLPAWLTRVGRPALFATCIFSHALLVATFWHRVPGWQKGGYAPEQIVAVSSFHFDEWRVKTNDAAAACGIDTRTARHLVLDDVTIMALWKTYRPFHWIYIDQHVTDVRGLLERYESDGIVTTCDRFPRTLREQARHVGDVCCMPRFRKESN